jgi:hypothetical protein
MMIMKMRRHSFKVPKKLLSRIPHFLDSVCSTQQKVFTARAIPMIFPGVCVMWHASRIFVANETDVPAVFSRMIKVIPYMQVARNTGLFNM